MVGLNMFEILKDGDIQEFLLWLAILGILTFLTHSSKVEGSALIDIIKILAGYLAGRDITKKVV